MSDTNLNPIEKLSKAAKSHGYDIPTYTSKSLKLVPESALKSSNDVLKAFDSYSEIISQDIETRPNPRNRDLAQLDRHINRYGLRVSNRFKDEFNEGDLIEIYDLSHRQLFRNLDFFRYCSYDLMTLAFVPWNELFERPEGVQMEIFKSLQEITDNSIEYKKKPTPVHILRECFEGASGKFVHSMKCAGSVFDDETGVVVGYITLINVESVESANLEIV